MSGTASPGTVISKKGNVHVAATYSSEVDVQSNHNLDIAHVVVEYLIGPNKALTCTMQHHLNELSYEIPGYRALLTLEFQCQNA